MTLIDSEACDWVYQDQTLYIAKSHVSEAKDHLSVSFGASKEAYDYHADS